MIRNENFNFHIVITALDFLLTSAKNCKNHTIFDNLGTITQAGGMKTRQRTLYFHLLYELYLHLKIAKIYFRVVTLFWCKSGFNATSSKFKKANHR